MNPTVSSFQIDTTFGTNGVIGLTNGATGTNNSQFNAPYDVAVSPDGGTISVSDSGNNRIQQFDTKGIFLTAFGSLGSAFGQFSAPKGLAYDSIGALYIVDSGNNRVVQSQSDVVMGMTGTNGTDVGQFQTPINLSASQRGIYVADTGNSRIQKYDMPQPNSTPFSTIPSTISSIRFALSTNFIGPCAVAAVDDSLVETFCVADTGNDRVMLYQFAAEDPTPAWTNMTARVGAGDMGGAVSNFSSASANRYQQAFLAIGPSGSLVTVIGAIGSLTPDFIRDNLAEYYFQQTIAGQTVTFPVTFVRENGVWKILEF